MAALGLTEIVYIALAAVSVANTVYSAVSSSDAGDEAAKAQKKAAAMEIYKYQNQANQEQTRMKALLAAGRSRVAGSGITEEGSPLMNEIESQNQFDKDLTNIRMGMQWELSNRMNAASAYESAGNAKATGTLLTGLGNLANTAYKNGWLTSAKTTTPPPEQSYDPQYNITLPAEQW